MTTPRKTHGFKRTSTLLQGQIRRVGESRGFAVTRLLTHWAEIAGPDIAAVARPVEVKYGREGFGATLTILTTGAQAPMLEMQKEQLREKVNAIYGYNAISRVRITQTAPSGFHEGRASFDHAPRNSGSTAPPSDPQLGARATAIAGDVGDDNLRHALETLARNVLSKNRK